MNKKGVSLSMEFIIIAALALLALIVIALFFTGGAEKLFGKQKGAVGVTIDPQIKSLAISTCELSCTFGNKDGYDNPNFPEEVSKQYTDCASLLNAVKGGNNDFSTKCGRCVKTAGSSSSCSGLSKSGCDADGGCNWEK
ncbi:MAG: hypothetical protein ABIB71_07190 [Candidatus Woesearchaeota archaeon]